MRRFSFVAILLCMMCGLAACAKERKLYTLLKKTGDSYNDAIYSPDGWAIVSIGLGKLRIWLANSGNLSSEFEVTPDVHQGITVRPDGKVILTFHPEDGTAEIWSPADGTQLGALKTRLLNPVYSPDSSRLLGAVSPGRLLIVEDTDSGEVDTPDAARAGVRIEVNRSPENTFRERELQDELLSLATTAGFFVNEENPRYRLLLSDSFLTVETCEYIPDRELAAIAITHKVTRQREQIRVTINDLETDEIIESEDFLAPEPEPCPDVLEDGRSVIETKQSMETVTDWIAGAFADKPALIASGQTLLVVPDTPSISSAQRTLADYSPDGQYVVATAGGTAYVWDLSKNEI